MSLKVGRALQPPAAPGRRQHFIREIVERDIAGGLGDVVTRFPPEPNGYLHIGHAKSICLNFGLAAEYGGRTHMRLDDTNPEKEEIEYTEAILEDVKWVVGGDEVPWFGPVRHASDYFGVIYEFAVELIRKGLAYVDSQSPAEMRASRGTLTRPGVNSPYRDRGVEENLRLFEEMRRGKLEEGSAVLRAKIDMGSPNLNLRDPALYRIKFARHPRTGNEWRVYPMYDLAHAASDAIENITHSLCTLEFEDHRPLYDWVVEHFNNVSCSSSSPRQIEFSRLNLKHAVTSKRELAGLVRDGAVDGWDDPRLPTIAGLRRRGVPAAAIRLFCERIGISKVDSEIDPALLDDCARDALEDAPRAFCVLDPIPLVLDDIEEEEELEAPVHPKVESLGTRRLLLSKNLVIDADDVWDSEERGMPPPTGWNRLVVPGGRVRLRYACVIRCEEVLRNPLRLKCKVERDTFGGKTGANGKAKGIIHWMSEERGEARRVRIFEPLFLPTLELNPRSVRDYPNAVVEPTDHEIVQFERLGYFRRDIDSSFNRIVPLRAKWTPPPKKEIPPVLDAVSKLEFVAGTVTSCEPHPTSEGLWCLEVACPEPRAVVVSSVPSAEKNDVVVVVVLKNTKPRKFGGFESQGVLLFVDEKLVVVPSSVAPGTRIAPSGCHDVEPAPPSQVKNKKLWEKEAQPLFSISPDASVTVGDRVFCAPDGTPAEIREEENLF
ncbi:hypothetical protein CTAYLR_004280 [Chrysophaeum taylorii]|uniref:glutamine--tRNA ligase n=1 Tax=Chrysophaeum taylorii TaxID=2483200 RepID=A0AAD7XIV0_9STRA|nr:hypothetical protein CTAYLR_004280 [Chrysophaeum taylorii]